MQKKGNKGISSGVTENFNISPFAYSNSSIPNTVISDIPPDFKPFILAKMCDIVMKLSGYDCLNKMWFVRNVF